MKAQLILTFCVFGLCLVRSTEGQMINQFYLVKWIEFPKQFHHDNTPAGKFEDVDALDDKTMTKEFKPNANNTSPEVIEGDKFKLACTSKKAWKKCWIYKTFKNDKNEDVTMGCKAIHGAGYSVKEFEFQL